MSLQAMMDSMSKMNRDTRSGYHVTLGQLIKLLTKTKKSVAVVCSNGGSLGGADSYRGYYADLCFEPTKEKKTVKDVLEEATSALDKTFTGYKGGDFVMDERTPLWVANYGDTGKAVVDVRMENGKLVVVTKAID